MQQCLISNIEIAGKKSGCAEQRAVTEAQGKKRESTTFRRRVRQSGKNTGMLLEYEEETLESPVRT